MFQKFILENYFPQHHKSLFVTIFLYMLYRSQYKIVKLNTTRSLVTIVLSIDIKHVLYSNGTSYKGGSSSLCMRGLAFSNFHVGIFLAVFLSYPSPPLTLSQICGKSNSR
jgi:hypothetical protein